LAWAHIGDTKKECEERYGKPVNQVNDITVFTSGEFYVFVTFFDGEADSVGYTRQKDGAITSSEIKSFLAANGKEQVWIEGPGGKSWVTLDMKILAYYYNNKSLIIATASRIERKGKE